MIDDCGNKWNCITIFGTMPHHHIKLGGGWKRMVQARRFEEGVMVKVGFPHSGMTNTIYIQVKHPAVVRVWCLQCNWWSAVFRVYVFKSILMFLNFLYILMQFMVYLSSLMCSLLYWMQFMVLKRFFVWLLSLSVIYGWLFTSN